MKQLSLIAILLISFTLPTRNVFAGISPHIGFFVFLPVMGVTGEVINQKSCRLVLCLDKVVAFAGLYAGILLLNENGGPLSFSKIDKITAQRIGLTVTERASFNESLEEINIIKDEIALEISFTSNDRLEHANALWSSTDDIFDIHTLHALKKVRSYMGRNFSLKN